MMTIGEGTAKTCGGWTRRDFLCAGSVGLGSLRFSLSDLRAQTGREALPERAVILLMLVGGPSQIETWDPKPEAPLEVRGPFQSIATRIPGVRISEHLPRMAQRMDRLAIIRTLHHHEAPIHETGQQLVQTGRLCRPGEEHPHVGSVAGRVLGCRGGLPPFVVVPRPIANTGVAISHGQESGWLGPAYEPFHLDADPASAYFDARDALDRARRFLELAASRESSAPSLWADAADHLLTAASRNAFDLADERGELRARYGRNTFGQSCLLARRLVEAGARLVTVNMFETVFDQITWDCHGARPFSTLDDYARELLPVFDQGFCSLIDDLSSRGLLDTTLVVATGEFGRTPRLNAAGGRDHWPGVWSAVLAGGGIRGGQVIGASDSIASAPETRPVAPRELVATMYRCLGIDPERILVSEAGGSRILGDDARAIEELF
jgi:hypothetical protein